MTLEVANVQSYESAIVSRVVIIAQVEAASAESGPRVGTEGEQGCILSTGRSLPSR